MIEPSEAFRAGGLHAELGDLRTLVCIG